MSANSSLCASGDNPVALSTSNVCNPGFYCPNNTAQHPPVYCPPTSECLITRLQPSENVCFQSQGIYEPMVCQPGFYCPRGGEKQLVCPKGHYCPLGTMNPLSCKKLSKCPEGSNHETPFLGILICGLLDLFLVALILYSRVRKRPHHGKGEDEQSIVEMQTMQNFTTDPADWLELLFAQDSRGAGIELEFRNVCLRRPRSTGCILSGVNGKAQASSLTGIMGPSGSGKTTLSHILVGKIRATSGSLLLNGVRKELDKGYHFPALIGFVPQDDIVHPHLTVFENILHSARVRLGGTLNDAAIKERVDIVVDGLGLRKIKHSVIGSELRRVISGGERKRVSIALELVAAPQVLVLDEPTSGLDAQAALSLMELLRLFSRKGLTVISVVHQPRVEIFEALDNLLILESGECVYSGKALKAQQYFEAQGYTFNPNLNPADLIIDIVSGKFHPPNGDLVKSEEQALPFLDLDVDSVPSGQDGSNTDASLFRAIEAEYSKRITLWYKQLYLCLVRDLTQQHRQIAVFTLEILGSALTGFMIGLVVFDFHGQLFQGIYLSPFQSLSSSVNYHLVPETGILCSLAISFSAAYPSVATFGEEILVFQRESHSGHSRVAYFSGKTIASLPRIFVASLHFTTFYAVMATSFAPFKILLLLNFLNFYFVYGIGSASAAISSRENGPLVSLLICIISAVLGGSEPTLATVKGWHMEWLWYMSPGLWFIEAFVNEHFTPFAYLFDMRAAALGSGYTFYRTGFDIGLMVIIGSIFRIIGCVIMVSRA